MPESPIRIRVHTMYWTPEEIALKTQIQRDIVRSDYDVDDPTECTLLAPYHGRRYTRVGNPGRKFKYQNVSCETEAALKQFWDLYDAARAGGGFDAPYDMNPVERRRQETAFYKNRALAAQAAAMAAVFVFNGNPCTTSAQALVAKGFLCELDIF